MPPVPDVSVVIPARNAAGTLPRTLDALARQSLAAERFEVIVADDGSTDTTRAIAKQAATVDRVVVIADAPRGPGAARNAGAVVARAPVLAFTDADCFPESTWLERGLAAIEDRDLVQGAVTPERPPGPFDRTVWVTGPHGLFETANLLVRRDVFTALGGFPTGLTPGGGKELGEDVLFGWLARRNGARVGFALDAVVAHAVLERGARGFVAERRRLEAFPALAAAVPELRSAAFWRRGFLTKRSAAFDAAALALALATRRPGALAAALPYAALVAKDARSRGARYAAASVVADAVGAAALVAGSIRHRSPLL